MAVMDYNIMFFFTYVEEYSKVNIEIHLGFNY
jgi:hypothetical protein